MAPTDKKELFFYLLLLTGFYFFLEISFFIQANKAYLSDFSYVSAQIDIPLSILPGLIYFLCAQLFIHLVYCFIVWGIAILITDLLQIRYALSFAIGVWILGSVTILLANQIYFPNSKFAELTRVFTFNKVLVNIFFIIALILCAWLVFLALIAYSKNCLSRVFYRYSFYIFSVLLFAGLFFKSANVIYSDTGTESKPHIILVGVDSLRPDFLGFFGAEKPTPFLDDFLQKSSVFGEAVTPLARTFPAWMSILTGSYPRELGIRFDLASRSHIKFDNTLSTILQHKGYQTIYATDETRFSNIDKSFGFDQIISPPIGLNDFLIGTFNDFPLSNLIVNSWLGRQLFPHSYGNRAVFFTYQPNSFLNLIESQLNLDKGKPLFLAVHFCLPHFPYIWANLQSEGLTGLERYQTSIGEIDKQLKQFFVLLDKLGVLKHAIVVILSDHGEALELNGDRITEKDLYLSLGKKNIPRFYPPTLDKEDINQSAGHGTDVLGLPQYHSLLAFRLYGFGEQRQKIIPGVVSLVDVKATILDLLGNEKLTAMSSLAPIIRGEKNAALSHKPIFLESDFSPQAIHTVYPDMRKVMLEGAHFFSIDPKTLRLTVKETMGEMIIRSKQYAVILDHWMLALYPQNQNAQLPILVDLITGQWTDDFQSDFAQSAKVETMLGELKRFYGEEIKILNAPLISNS